MRIFLSSTSEDLRAYREAVAAKVEALGQMPSRMETFSAAPRTPVAESLAKVSEADAVVLIVAHRYGWVPGEEHGGDGEKSITRIEVEAALGAEPPIPVFAFVVDARFAWTGPRDSVDLEGAEDENAEREIVGKTRRLRAFKHFIDDNLTRQTFTSPEDLAGKVVTALHGWILERQRPPAADGTSASVDAAPGEPDAEGLDRYLARVHAQHSYLRMAGFPRSVRMDLRLDRVFIPLRAHFHRGFFGDELDDLGASRQLPKHQGESEADLSFDEALALATERGDRGLVVLGNPGGGKTTLLRHFALEACRPREQRRLRLAEDLVPVLVPLRRLRDPTAGLATALSESVARSPLSVPDADAFTETLLSRDRLLVLLDGLDEIADVARREAVSRWLETAITEQPGSLFVVSSRYAGYYEGEVRIGGRFLEVTIRDLEEPEARVFIARWYRAVEERIAVTRPPEVSREVADEQSDALCGRIFGQRGTGSLRELARNPLMLQILCLVHRDSKRLPEERAALYEDCCRVLLQTWREAKKMPVDLGAEKAMRVLQPVAWALHRSGEREAPADVVLPAMHEPLRAIGRDPADAEPLLVSIRDQSGLAVRSQGLWSFLHLTFQEYLAARHVKARGFDEPALVKELASRFGDDAWREVILLAVALEPPSLFGRLVREVIEQERLHTDDSLASDLVRDASETSASSVLACLAAGIADPLERFAALRLVRSLPTWQEAELPDDVAALDVIGQIASVDDNEEVASLAREIMLRADVGREAAARSAPDLLLRRRHLPVPGEERLHEVDGSVLVYVPGGRYTLGSDDKKDRERPIYEVDLSPFWIGKYPVTHAQYRLFLEAESGAEEPDPWQDRRFNDPRQPVVGVSWHDAVAYCEWSGLALPSEAQWEAAARGIDQRPYPWGDEPPTPKHANFDNREGRTTPVGAFPRGGGPFGTLDQAGNVWEWCADVWNGQGNALRDGQRDPLIEEGVAGDRALRGGAWNNPARDLRAAVRDGSRAVHRNPIIGFRCVLSSRLEP